MRRAGAIRLAALAVAGAAWLAGCVDEPPPVGGGVQVEVRAADTDARVAGIKVVVMDGASNRPIAPPLRTDGQTAVTFQGSWPAAPQVLVFGGVDWRPFGEPFLFGGASKYGSAATDPGLLAPKTSPAPPPALVRVVPAAMPRGSTIAGTVVDAVSGDPLECAFVSTNIYPLGAAGGTGPGDDVTLVDGAFALAGILFLELRPGEVQQVTPIVATRVGYRPRLWRYEPAPGEAIDAITGATIALEPLDPDSTGTLRGRVLRAGAAVQDLVVALGWAETYAKAGPGAVGLTARTDAEGRFVFADLPAGRYVLVPGYGPGDQAWFYDQAANTPRTVAPGQDVDAGDYAVVWEIDAWTPADGAVLRADTPVSFAWSPVPGATSYTISLDGSDPVRTAEPAWRPEGDAVLPVGAHAWGVMAFGPGDEGLGAMGRWVEFQVRQ